MSKQQILELDKTSEFIRQAKTIHNNRYTYDSSVYTNARSKVIINCKDHGPFEQLPRKHLKGQKCPKCSAQEANNYRKISGDEFVRRAKAIHGNKYLYKQYDLANLHTKVEIECPKHGLFIQLASTHILHGCGCPKCAKKSAIIKDNSLIYNTEWFISRAKDVHGDIYDYCMARYAGSDKKLLIICSKHGNFEQTARDHLNKMGCPKCGTDKLSKDNRKSLEVFESEANKVHSSRYDYSAVEYINNNTEIEIICVKHGAYKQTPKNHLRGQGCPACRISSGQQAIYAFLQKIYDKEIIINDRSTFDGYEIDLFLPDIKLAIEYHGLYCHSFNRTESKKEILRHHDKATIATNVKLLQFMENEWLYKRELVESIILHNIGLSVRYYARSCDMIRLDSTKFIDVMSRWHLSGGRHASNCYGLMYDGELVSAIGFSKHSKHEWEIIRYASKPGHFVVGGLSKMFKRFIEDNNPNQVMTFADRRISNGNCYRKIGFSVVKITKPNYFYVKGNRLFSRLSFQKHKLKGKLGIFNSEWSESANMFINGFRRIWDAGHIKLIWRSI
jgi:Zn finger protein HypA/HybF involved in hydrogenase expression